MTSHEVPSINPPQVPVTNEDLAKLIKDRNTTFSWSAAIIVLSMLGGCSINARLDRGSIDKITTAVGDVCKAPAGSSEADLRATIAWYETQVPPTLPPVK